MAPGIDPNLPARAVCVAWPDLPPDMVAGLSIVLMVMGHSDTA
jgi:hypothetical protein